MNSQMEETGRTSYGVWMEDTELARPPRGMALSQHIDGLSNTVLHHIGTIDRIIGHWPLTQSQSFPLPLIPQRLGAGLRVPPQIFLVFLATSRHSAAPQGAPVTCHLIDL